MKKVIIACLLLVSLTSCSNKAEEQPIRTVSAVETTTEAEIPQATEPETISKVLYDDNYFTFTYNGFNSGKLYQSFNYTLSSHSNDMYSIIVIKDLTINNIPFDIDASPIAEPNTTVSHTFRVSNDKLQEQNITKVNEISFKLEVCYAETLSGNGVIDKFTTDTITITR